MQTSKTRNGSSDALQRTSPRTPRSSRVAKTGGDETNSAGVTPTRTPTDRSPKVTERRSPRSPITEKKRPSRLSELEARVSQLQDELKKAKEQLSASEARRRQAQQEAEEAKKQEQDALSKASITLDLQRQLAEFSAAEDTRIQELRKITQERDRAWESELDAVQKQQSVDATALGSAMAEVQRLKQQLEAAAESGAARARQCEDAEAEVEGLRQEMEIRLATIEGLKVTVGENDRAVAEANTTAAEMKQQLETAKATIDSLVAEGAFLQELLRDKDVELSESKARVASLEEDLKKAQAEVTESLRKKAQGSGNNMDVTFGGNAEPEALKKVLSDANGSCGSSADPEIEQLRTALEVAEVRYQEEHTRMCIETKTAYEMLENVKAECARTVRELELQLHNKQDELVAAKACTAPQQQEVVVVPTRPDGCMQQPELEARLMQSATDMAELKASLMDKETALQSLAEENATLRSEAGRAEAELRGRYEAAVAELELAKAAEQDVRMRLGLVTEEADKSSRRAARAAEQLDAAQVAAAEMEAELRRLRVQSDQWRKAAEAAAAALGGAGGGDDNGGGNHGRVVERTGSLDAEYSSIGGKLMSSPFSDEVDESSPVRRRNSSGVLRRMSGLWKKSPK